MNLIFSSNSSHLAHEPSSMDQLLIRVANFIEVDSLPSLAAML